MAKMDQHLIAGKQSYEVAYAAKVLGVKKEDILKAIKKVGNGRDAVVKYLIKNPAVLKKVADKLFK